MVLWLRLCPSNAGDVGLIPGWGTKLSRARWHSPLPKKKLSVIQICRDKRGFGIVSILSWKRKKPRDYGDSVDFPGEREVGNQRPEEDFGGSEGGLS